MIALEILFAVLLGVSCASSVRGTVNLPRDSKERGATFAGLKSGSNRAKRQASIVDNPNKLWMGQPMYVGVSYFFDPSLSQSAIDAMRQAIEYYRANTCILFTEYATVDAPRWQLRFMAGPVCYSRVGRNYDAAWAVPENVTLSADCENVAGASKLMGQALNMWNAQSRSDRDDWIWLNLDNVVEQNKGEFIKTTPAENDNFGFRYDFRSIMHDKPSTYSIDPSTPTMVAFDTRYQMSMGASQLPVFSDIAQLNKLYQCNACASSTTQCARGGYPHPKNCSTCLCPSGFGGADCSERQAPSANLACGQTLAAADDWQVLKQNLVCGDGAYTMGNVTNPSLCTYHIQAPAGHRIEYWVNFIGYDERNDALCQPQCASGGLDVKGHDLDFRPEGYRLCCQSQLDGGSEGRSFYTSGDLLVVQAYNNYRYTDFQIMYRIDPCGANLTATPQFQWLKSNQVVGNGLLETADRNNPKTCTWKIEAPAGSKLLYAVNFVGFDGNNSALCYWDCWYGAVAMQGDQNLKFCCQQQTNQLVRVAGNTLTVEVTNIFRYTEFQIQYAIDPCASVTTSCLNGGVPDPNSCGLCVCRPGFAGADCSERAPPTGGMPWTCGTTLLAVEYWQWFARNEVVGYGSWTPLDQNNPAMCTYIIEAPVGKLIEYSMNFVGFDGNENGLCTGGCVNGGVVVRGHNALWDPEGITFCCSNDYNQIRTSATNLLVVQAWNSLRYTNFQIAYHFV